jgi:hypothetical protein
MTSGTQEYNPDDDSGDDEDNKLDEEELKMFEDVNKVDKEADKELKKFMEEKKEAGVFKRLAEYNKPCYLIIIGLFGAAVNGSIQPFIGVIFGKLMTLMTTPPTWMELLAKAEQPPVTR